MKLLAEGNYIMNTIHGLGALQILRYISIVHNLHKHVSKYTDLGILALPDNIHISFNANTNKKQLVVCWSKAMFIGG